MQRQIQMDMKTNTPAVCGDARVLNRWHASRHSADSREELGVAVLDVALVHEYGGEKYNDEVASCKGTSVMWLYSMSNAWANRCKTATCHV